MKISTIVFCDPLHDNSGDALLGAYRDQTLDYDEFEVVVVDNCQRTAIEAVANRLNVEIPRFNLRYLQVDTIGRAATVNFGLKNANAPLIAIMADDAVPTQTALESFVNFHESNSHPLAVAIGPTLFREALRRDALRRWLEDSGTQFGVPMRTTFSAWPQQFFFTGNCSMKRELFDEIGLFNEAFPWITWDDFEFGTRLMKAGGYSQLVIGALAWHEHYVTLAERAGAMRKGGHAALIHERIGPIVRPWSAMLDRANRVRNETLLPDDPALPLWQRVPRFEKLFDREFLLGYERELAADRSDLIGLEAST
jgi:glycosyltransferase involved in cell wall biosynthesis